MHYHTIKRRLSKLPGLSIVLICMVESAIDNKQAGNCRREWLADKMQKQPEFAAAVLEIYDQA